MGFLAALGETAVVVFSVSSMLSAGLANPLRELLGRLRNVRGVLRVLAANFVAVPLLGLLVVRLVPLEPPAETGLLLVAAAAGAPFQVKLTELAEGDLGFSTTLLVVLLPATVVLMPVVVPLLTPGAEVSAGAVALPLLLTMLLPLAVGLLAGTWRPRWGRRLRPLLGRISTVALLTLVAATILANLRALLGLVVEGTLLASLLLVVGAFAVGYATGGLRPDVRSALALGTAQRNIVAATVVATQSFGDPRVTLMVVATSLVTLAVLFPAAAVLRRTDSRVPGLRGRLRGGGSG